MPLSDSLLLDDKFIHRYNTYIVILSLIDNKESIAVIKEHYQAWASMHDNRWSLLFHILNIDNMSYSIDQIKGLMNSYNTMLEMLDHTIKILGSKNDRSILNDCLARLSDSKISTSLAIFEYLSQTAVGDTSVINRLIDLYTDPNSKLYQDIGLKNVIIEIGGKVEVDPDEVLSNLIEYINTQSDEGNIDNSGVANSLIAKLETAQKQFKDEKPKQAVNALNAFLNELEAQQSRHISEEVYSYLKEKVEELIVQIE
ncbi:hypothetical protein ACFL4L_02365 [bacterium]